LRFEGRTIWKNEILGRMFRNNDVAKGIKRRIVTDKKEQRYRIRTYKDEWE
jgi:hypothetical protein